MAHLMERGHRLLSRRAAVRYGVWRLDRACDGEARLLGVGAARGGMP